MEPSTRERRRLRPLAAAALIAMGAIILAAVLLGGRGEDARSTGAREAPALEMPVLGGEGTVAIASLRGRPVVINTFASWCIFCAAEMPDFEKVHAEVSGRVTFIGVAVADEPSAAMRLAEKTGVTYTLVDDPEGAAFDALGGRGMPTTVFIDDRGRIVERFTGPMSDDALRARISRHFDV